MILNIITERELQKTNGSFSRELQKIVLFSNVTNLGELQEKKVLFLELTIEEKCRKNFS